MTFNYPRFPDPPEDHSLDSYVLCPHCQSDSTGVVRKGISRGNPFIKYVCYDCDEEWITFDPIYDDDIPF